MNHGEYIEQRLQDQIDWYDRKSSKSRTLFMRLKIAEIVAAALIPFLSAVSISQPTLRTASTVAVGVLGMTVTIIAGVLSLGQHQERWVEYRATCESLRREKFLFQTGVEPYDGADSFPLLVQRVEALLSKEKMNWTQHAGKPEHEKAEGQT